MIIDVKEDWEGLEFDQGVEEASAPRVFTVKFDNDDDPFVRPALAWGATGPGESIPYIYGRHPRLPWMWVHHKHVRALGPCLFEVSVYYSTRPIGPADQDQIDPTISPLDLPWEVEWGFATREVQIDRTIDGDPIVNSAGAAFDPPITRPFSDLVLSIRRNQADYNPIMAADYKDALNSDPFFGFAPGIVRCIDLSGRSARNADLFYWQVRHAFQIRKVGWKFDIIDRGFSEDNGTLPDGKPDHRIVKAKLGTDDDAQEIPINELIYLDGNGKEKKKSDPPVTLFFDIFEKKPFFVLGL